MLTGEPKFVIEIRVQSVSMPPSPVVITLRGWKEKHAICPWGLPIGSHRPLIRIWLPAAQAASSINAMSWRSATAIRAAVARHPHLVDCKNGTGLTGYGFGHTLWIKIIGARIDIHENRSRATISYAVGRCDE